jgi:hypothetical protein
MSRTDFMAANEGVDGRDRPGHDDRGYEAIAYGAY